MTVVVCAYTPRRWPWIVRAIASACGQRPEAEVILVVDHEETLLDRARRTLLGVQVVPNTGPRGLSGARNTGVAQARGEVVAFLDDDAEAGPDWLSRLLRHYRDPAVLAVGGRAVPDWDRFRPRWLPPEFDWVVGCSFTGQPAGVSPVRNLIGCNMSFRTRALRQVGGFDAALGRVGTVPVGCEETELCIRLRQRWPGGVILYDPDAVVRHHVTADRGSWRYFRRRCFAEGRSKAVVARLVGGEAGLASEREYARRVLPHGVGRELLSTATGDVGALLRAGAIVAGLAATGSGYLLAKARRVTDSGAAGIPRAADGKRRGSAPRRRAGSPPQPVRVLAVELADGVPDVPDADGAGRYPTAQVLVRLHGHPLGMVRVDLPPGGLTAREHADRIGRELADDIADHLRRDGLDPVHPLPVDGLGPASCPPHPATGCPPFVTVVVPTCGRPALLRRCLAALTALDYPRFEVVVVDNAPHEPDTAALVAEYARQDARVRRGCEPRPGVTYARNRGLADARGEIVAFVDDDVIVDRGWLRAVVDAFADAAVAAVTGHLLPTELDTPAQLWVEQYGSFDKGNLPRRFDATGYDTLESGQPRRVDAAGSLYPYLPGIYGSGGSMAFRTATLRRLGGFDPLLGSRAGVPAGEDIDLLMRLVLAGHTLVYEPAAIAWHAHKRDMARLRRTIFDYGVGLGAVITKSVVTDPAQRREIARRVPGGLVYALHPGSAKNARKQGGYPISLTLLELSGMALGPVRYARAAWTARHRGAGG